METVVLEPRRIKKCNYNPMELAMFLEELEANKDILFPGASGCERGRPSVKNSSVKDRREVYQAISSKMAKVGMPFRTWEELRKKKDNWFRATRYKAACLKRQQRREEEEGVPVGPPMTPLTSEEQRILALIGEDALQGLEQLFEPPSMRAALPLPPTVFPLFDTIRPTPTFDPPTQALGVEVKEEPLDLEGEEGRHQPESDEAEEHEQGTPPAKKLRTEPQLPCITNVMSCADELSNLSSSSLNSAAVNSAKKKRSGLTPKFTSTPIPLGNLTANALIGHTENGVETEGSVIGYLREIVRTTKLVHEEQKKIYEEQKRQTDLIREGQKKIYEEQKRQTDLIREGQKKQTGKQEKTTEEPEKMYEEQEKQTDRQEKSTEEQKQIYEKKKKQSEEQEKQTEELKRLTALFLEEKKRETDLLVKITRLFQKRQEEDG